MRYSPEELPAIHQAYRAVQFWLWSAIAKLPNALNESVVVSSRFHLRLCRSHNLLTLLQYIEQYWTCVSISCDLNDVTCAVWLWIVILLIARRCLDLCDKLFSVGFWGYSLVSHGVPRCPEMFSSLSSPSSSVPTDNVLIMKCVMHWMSQFDVSFSIFHLRLLQLCSRYSSRPSWTELVLDTGQWFVWPYWRRNLCSLIQIQLVALSIASSSVELPLNLVLRGIQLCIYAQFSLNSVVSGSFFHLFQHEWFTRRKIPGIHQSFRAVRS